jgi:hypothetical protein
MKGSFLLSMIAVLIFSSCSKTNTSADGITITASATTVVVGQTVALQVNTGSNAVNWSVTPSATAVMQYTITDKKTNTVSFTQPGTYTLGVRARNINYDPFKHQDLDSCWHSGGGDRGNCRHGIDSASVSIEVSK